MSTLLTIILFVAGITLLAISLSSAVISLRNKTFRAYISLRPQRVLKLLSEWYPTLDIQVSQDAALALMPVPWTVVEAIVYANEQSRRIISCLVPTVNTKTQLVDANKLHTQAVNQFLASGKLEQEKTLAEIRRLQGNPQGGVDSQNASTADMTKTINEAVRNSLRQCLFDKPFESNLVTLIRYLREPEEFRREGLKIIEQLLTERNGGEDDRIRMENHLNQFIQRRFKLGEEE